MSIRWQNIFAIVPIFLVVGLASGWLRLKSDDAELVWGFREQSAGVTTAVASFLDGENWTEVSKPGSPAAAAFGERLTRIFQSGTARQIYGLSADGKKIAFNFAPEGARKRRPLVDSETLTALNAGETYTTDILQDAESGSLMVGYAYVKDAEGKPQGIVGTVVSADEYTRAWNASVAETAWLCAGVTVLGFIVALVISAIFCARLRELKGAADILAAGEYEQRLEPALVRELSDLSDTFNTVGSILGELSAKSRQSVVEAEQFRTDEDLKSTYCATFFPPASRDAKTRQLAGCLANEKCVGDFFEIFDGSGGTFAVLGRVDADSLSDKMIDASAACAMSRELLLSLTPEDACRRVRDCFVLNRWECVIAEHETGRVRHWQLRRDGALECRDFGTLTSAKVIHTLSASAARDVEEYLGCLPELEPEEILGEISPLLSREPHGAAVVVGNFNRFQA